MTGKSKGVEEDYSGKFPITYNRVVKIPAQISWATNIASTWYHKHVAIDACILLSREPF